LPFKLARLVASWFIKVKGALRVAEKVLITGGAGFIGSHLADALLELGHKVTAFDNLHPQIHGARQQTPAYLNPDVEFIEGDIRDDEALQAALENKSVVFHLAAYTGVGQSMYQIQEYMDVNVQGTAGLLELLSQNVHQARKLILASSRAVYGEGACQCSHCGLVNSPPRSTAQLQEGSWEITCPRCYREVKPVATPESKTPDPRSIYAISKQTQEQICLLVGETYKLPVSVLRYFNVYGPRQSLRNPYTGVLNTFITRLLNGKPPQVYEDGRESRDFVHVKDVVQACLMAMTREEANGQIINVGSGQALSLLQAAQTVARIFGGPEPIITGQYRAGDIRHCHADLSRARQLLGYEPGVMFEDGMRELIDGLADQYWEDRSLVAEIELQKHGLTGKV
jgi:dTDP-L-rhamnose 4-epimerase